MKTAKILIVLLIIHCSAAFSQTVVDTLSITFPYIGYNGGCNLMTWNFNADKSAIYLYAASNIGASLGISSPEEMAQAKASDKKKSFFGRLLTGSASPGMKSDYNIPIVLEKEIAINKLKQTNEKTMVFHNISQVPEGKTVYYSRMSGIVDLDKPSGEWLPIKSVNTMTESMKYASVNGKEIARLYNAGLYGSGLLGMKNLQPWITLTTVKYNYNPLNGFISEKKDTNLVCIKSETPEITYEIAENQLDYNRSKGFLWLFNRKNKSSYIFVNCDLKTNAVTKTTYSFEAPRELRVVNKPVYDRQLNLKGYISIFGYNKDGKDKKDLYPEDKYDLIYTDTQGNLKYQCKFTFGDGKFHRNIINPILVIEDNDQQLSFANDYGKSIFSCDYQYFTINKDGNVDIKYTTDYVLPDRKSAGNIRNYLITPQAIHKVGKYFLVETKRTDNVNVEPPGKSYTVDRALCYTLLDSVFKPIKCIDVLPMENGNQKPIFLTQLDSRDEVFTAIAQRGSDYFLFSIDGNGEYKNTYIKNPYPARLIQAAEPKPVFSDVSTGSVLVDKAKRNCYIMYEYYGQLNGAKLVGAAKLLKVQY